MRWKKSVFSYVMWAVYSLGVCLVYGSILIETGNELGIESKAGAIGMAAMVWLVLILMFTGMRRPVSRGGILAVKSSKGREGKKRKIWLAAETAGVAFLLILGFVLRIFCLDYAGEEAAYFETARMVQGQGIPQVAHGAAYVYLQVLHFLFLLVGNKWMAGIWLQIFLQMTACILLYLGVRRLAGRMPALVMAAFLMFSPARIAEGLTYSPRMLYLCIYAVGLLCIALFLDKRAKGAIRYGYDWILLFLAGTMAAVVCYLDITGVTLLLLASSVLWLRKEPKKNLWGNSLLELLVILAGAAVSFSGCMALDAFASGKKIGGVWRAWCSLYQAKAYDNAFWLPTEGERITFLVLFTLLFLGILSFWCRKLSEKNSPWMLMLIGVCLIQFFHMSAEGMDAGGLFFWICTVMAGNAVADCFYHDVHRSAKERKEDREEEKFVMRDEPEESPVESTEEPVEDVNYPEEDMDEAAGNIEQSAENTDEAGNEERLTEDEEQIAEAMDITESIGKTAENRHEAGNEEQLSESIEQIEEDVDESETMEQPVENMDEDAEDMEQPTGAARASGKVKLLDNPLPLPKKHIRKVMDYRVQPEESDMEYDIEVDEDDDFDID